MREEERNSNDYNQKMGLSSDGPISYSSLIVTINLSSFITSPLVFQFLQNHSQLKQCKSIHLTPIQKR